MNKDEAVTAAIRSVAVIGAGRRGRDFARRCAEAGYRVVLEDVLSSRLRTADEELHASEAAWAGRIALVGSVEDAVRDVDVAVDFVPDELESKLEIFSMMDRMAPPRTLFCTPTALSISDLAACTYRAGRCFALVPFDEAAAAGWHVVHPPQADAAALAEVSAFLRSLGLPTDVAEEPAA